MSEQPSLDWQLPDLAAQLQTTAHETRELGQPQPFTRLSLGEPPTTQLDLQPERGSLRITTAASRIELADLELPVFTASGVIFERTQHGERLWLALTAAGDVTLSLYPAPAATRAAASAARPTAAC